MISKFIRKHGLLLALGFVVFLAILTIIFSKDKRQMPIKTCVDGVTYIRPYYSSPFTILLDKDGKPVQCSGDQ